MKASLEMTCGVGKGNRAMTALDAGRLPESVTTVVKLQSGMFKELYSKGLLFSAE